MASNEGDTVLDPFGGSGTTYIVAEIKKRNWIGVEIGSTSDIVERFKTMDQEKDQLFILRSKVNKLFPDKIKAKRKKIEIWTDDSFHENS